MDFLRYLHSGMRWVVVAALIVALLYMLIGLLQSRAWDKRAQTVLTIFSSLVGLQWIIGLVFLVAWGSQTGFGIRHYWEHLFWQTIALGVAHVHYSWRRRQMADAVRYRNGFIMVLAVFGFIFVGIMVLPEGMRWRLTPTPSVDVIDTRDIPAVPAEVTPEATPAA